MSRLLAGAGVRHAFDARPGAAAETIRPRQVHGERVVVLRAAPAAPGDADGLVSVDPGPAIAIVTADCVPLLLAGASGAAVAAVHAGWRGIAAGIVERAVAALAGAGADVPLLAALGPAASGCCYEVGAEVAERLGEPRRPPGARLSPRGRPLLDLRAIARSRLIAAGLDGRRIERVGPCTVCSSGWPSWRRDGERAGRLVAWIAPRGGAGAGEAPGA